MINFISVVTENTSDGIKSFQSGKIADYVLWFFAGVILISLLIVFAF